MFATTITTKSEFLNIKLFLSFFPKEQFKLQKLKDKLTYPLKGFKDKKD